MANDVLHFSLSIGLSTDEYKWFLAYFERHTESSDPPLYVWDIDQTGDVNKLVIDIDEHKDIGYAALMQVTTLLQNMIQMRREAVGETQPTSQEEDDAGSQRDVQGVVRTDG